VDALVKAATLDGKAPAGTMDPRTLVRLLLTALGVQNVDEIVDLVAPEGGESLMDQMAAARAQMAQAAADAAAGAQPADAQRQAAALSRPAAAS
jgi:hypothetical protein